MLQFNKSETTNTNAVWIDTVNTGSGYYSNLRVVYSQSYDLSNGTINISTVSAPNQYRNWLVISNAGAAVPTPSGQYDISIYTITTGSGGSTWATATETFASTTQTWGGFTGGGTLEDLIYSDRAYVSGSNEQEITQYVSSNENGTYTTYNG
jgi:hypothetical protein